MVVADFSTFSTFRGIDWNYRVFGTRSVLVKAKNNSLRKVAAIDIFTNLPFGFEVPENISVESVEIEKEYSVTLRVYTSKNAEGVEREFADFFEVLDVDQSFEDFIRAYLVYPQYVAFELTEIELLL